MAKNKHVHKFAPGYEGCSIGACYVQRCSHRDSVAGGRGSVGRVRCKKGAVHGELFCRKHLAENGVAK